MTRNGSRTTLMALVSVLACSLVGCSQDITVERCPSLESGAGCSFLPATDLAAPAEADLSTVLSGPALGVEPSSPDMTNVGDGGTLETEGNVSYVVSSVTGLGQYCIDLPAAVFGTVGDTITFDFDASGVYLNKGVQTGFDSVDFLIATQMQSNLGGSSDTTNGKYIGTDSFEFIDDQNPGGLGSSPAFYFGVYMTRSGNTITIQIKIPNPAGDVTCVLTRTTP